MSLDTDLDELIVDVDRMKVRVAKTIAELVGPKLQPSEMVDTNGRRRFMWDLQKVVGIQVDPTIIYIQGVGLTQFMNHNKSWMDYTSLSLEALRALYRILRKRLSQSGTHP